MCAVTWSTLHNALGLGTLVQQKNHYDFKFGSKKPPEPHKNLQKILDYGTRNEVCPIEILLLVLCNFATNFHTHFSSTVWDLVAKIHLCCRCSLKNFTFSD